MSEINIVTAQNVTLKIELANIGDRFVAALMDFSIKVGIMIMMLIFIGLFRDTFVVYILGALMIIDWMFYSLLFEFFLNGQSPGKKIMQIRVARLDGGPLTFGDLMLRWLFRIFDFFMGVQPAVGVTAIVMSEKHQRLGDLVASTIIVSTKERTKLTDTFYNETTEGYVPVFPLADRLTPRDAEIIQEVLHQYQQNDKYELITLTAHKVKELLQAHTGLDDLTFLKTVIKDYNVAAAHEGKPFEGKEEFGFSV